MNHTTNYLLIILSLFVSELNAEPGWVFLPGIEEATVESSQPLALKSTFAQTSNVITVPEGDEITDEIAELARGLQHDPVAIYNYVRNEIDYIPYYGLKKGAALCLIEKSGNDFDQCALLAALLKESAYTPVYHYGTMTIPLNSADDMDMLAWLPATSSNGVKNMLRWTGNPNYNPSGSNFTPIRVWVEIEINNKTYRLDPAYKHYETLPALADVLNEIDYNIDNYISVAAGDETLSGIDPAFYTENLDESAIYERLIKDTQSLLIGLKTNYPNRSPHEIIGGRRLIREIISDIASLPQTLPFESNTTETWNYGEIPETYAAKVNFTITNRMDITLYTAELQGKRLALTLNSSTGSNGTRAALWLDDTKIAEESSSSGSSANMRISITHPSTTFTAGNQSDGGRVYKRGANYAILYGFDVNGGLMNHRQKKLEAYRVAGLENDSREILTETLNIIGQQWLYQTELFQRISSTIDPNLLYFNYHRIGRMSQEEGFYIDVPLQTFVTMSRTGTFIPGNPAIYGYTYFASAMEHGVLQQTQGAENGAVSTIKMIETANYNNGNPQGRVFYADKNNFQTGNNIRNQLNGYSSSTLNSINSILNQNTNNFILLPQKGNFKEGDWTGTGYMQIRGSSIGMIISGIYGGYSTNFGMISPPSLFNRNIAAPTYYSYNPPSLINPRSWDPVDMATGAFLLDSKDLTMGEDNGPRGLSFSRSYNSQRRADQSSDLGYGWTHNWKGSVTIRSAIDAGLCETTTAEATPLILAAATVNNLIENRAPRSAKNWVIAALICDWATDQLLDNAASVTIGKRTLQFIRMPDGSYVAPAGISNTLVKESTGDFVLSERFGNSYRFDKDNDYRLESITDIYGKSFNIAYKADGKLDYVEDAYDRRLTFTYSGDRISRLTDSSNRTISYAYDSEGNLTRYTDPDNNSTQYHYHDKKTGANFAKKHLMVAIENGKGEITIRNFYDTQYRVYKQYGDDNPAREYQLFFNGRQNVEMDPRGAEMSYFFSEKYRDLGSANQLGQRTTKTYDGQDHLIQTLTPKSANIGAEYDADHNLLSRSIPENLKVLYTYDTLHRPTEIRIRDLSDTSSDRVTQLTYKLTNTTPLPDSITDSLGNVTEYTYYADGLLHTQKQISTKGNRLTTYTYDSYGMPKTIHYPDSTSDQFTYNERGDLVSHTNRRSETTTYQYNARRQLTQTTYPDTGTVLNTYDSAGNLLTVTDHEGTITHFTYSPQGKVLTETTAYGTTEAATTTHEYDARDWRIRTTDPLSRITQFEYDAAGRVIKTIDPLNRATTFTYDADGNRISTTTPEAITTKFNYNERGERITLTDPADNTILHTRNAFGEQTALTNRRSQTFQFTFDDNGNPLTTVTPLGYTRSMAYNDLSQVERIEEPSSQSTTFAYDLAGRVKSQTDPLGTITTTYDSSGNPLTVTEGSSVLTRTFDAMDRVATYTDANGNQIKYTYFKNGRLKTLKYPDDKTVTYAYDAHQRLKTVTDWSGRVTTYTWDAVGRLTRIDRPNGTHRVNEYTAADELDRFYEYAPNQSKLHIYNRFSYDGDSRIEWRYRIPKPKAFELPPFTATYDADNRTATYNGTTVTCDPDGNMTHGPLPSGTFGTYAYDSRNRLTSADGIRYQYDPEGNRIAQTDSKGTTTYVIDSVSALPRVLVRTKPDGTTTHYIYGVGLAYQINSDGTTHTHHYNHLGNTVALTDDQGTVTDRVEYSPYGIITHREGTTDTPFLYSGQHGVMTDSNGLIHMRARYYNPTIRRFINADPIQFEGGTNWYLYANGNPILYVDPSGNVPLIPALIALGSAFIGSSQFLNAPDVGDITSNEAPLMDEALLLTGLGSVSLGGKLLVQASTTGIKNTVTQGAFYYGAGASLAKNRAQSIAANLATNPNLSRNVGKSLGSLAFAGAINEATTQFDTAPLTNIDFGGGLLGSALDTGLNAFNLGASAVNSFDYVGDFLDNHFNHRNDFFNSKFSGRK